jgi:hypothetical protein
MKIGNCLGVARVAMTRDLPEEQRQKRVAFPGFLASAFPRLLSWQPSGPESPPGFVSCLDSDWRRSGAGPDLGLGSPADVSRSPSSSPTPRNRAFAGSQEREITELHVPAFPRSLFPRFGAGAIAPILRDHHLRSFIDLTSCCHGEPRKAKQISSIFTPTVFSPIALLPVP